MKPGEIWYEKFTKNSSEKFYCRITGVDFGKYSHYIQRLVEYDYEESLIFSGAGEDYLISYDFWIPDENSRIGGRWESAGKPLGRPAFLALYYRPDGLVEQ